MKKLLLFFLLILFLFSCSNMCDKAANTISSEIGKPTNSKEFKDKSKMYVWDGIELGKSDMLKNKIDKVVGMLPTETSDMKQSYDESGNEIKGEFIKYWIYESSTFKINLEYYLNGDKMVVKLFTQNK